MHFGGSEETVLQRLVLRWVLFRSASSGKSSVASAIGVVVVVLRSLKAT